MHPATAAVDALPRRHDPSRLANSLSSYTIIVDENITVLMISKGRRSPRFLFRVLLHTVLEPLPGFGIESFHAFSQQSEHVEYDALPDFGI